MLAAGIALVVIGLLLSLFLGYGGLIVAAVGLVVLLLAVVGFGRRSAQDAP